MFCSVALLLAVSAPAQSAPSPTPQSTLPDSTKLLILHKEIAVYPIQAQVDRRQGQVLVKMRVDESGNVSAAEAVSGDEIFREPALDAAKKFKFQPYIRGGKAVPVVTTIPFDFAFRENVRDEPESLPPISAPARRTRQLVIKEEPAGNGPAAPIADPATTGTTPTPIRVRVGAGVSQGLLLHKVSPVYPPDARHYHISGKVVLQAIIGRDGTIKNLHVISGPRELAKSALDAVQQWRYRPYYLNGQPVEIDTQITVNYELSPF